MAGCGRLVALGRLEAHLVGEHGRDVGVARQQEGHAVRVSELVGAGQAGQAGHGSGCWPDNSACCSPVAFIIRFSYAVLLRVEHTRREIKNPSI